MSSELQSILLEDLAIRWPGILLRRVALNQHMPRVERLSEHRHDYAQLLLYLRGHGIQRVEGETIPVGRGDVLHIPPGHRHRFLKEGQLRPVCLAIDLETKGETGWQRSGRLTASGLARIERGLVSLHEQTRRKERLRIETASLILRILAETQRPLEPGDDTPGPVFSLVFEQIKRLPIEEASPGEVARRLGQSLDHLNRRLRSEAEMTIGDVINRERLTRCGELLRQPSMSIGEVGSAIGMDDQNYFSRWFRKQTGQTPTRWREAMRSAAQDSDS